jgi:hypothetical protein
MTGRKWTDRAAVVLPRSRRGRVFLLLAAWVAIYGLGGAAYRVLLHKTWVEVFALGGVGMASGIIAPFLHRFVERSRGRSR